MRKELPDWLTQTSSIPLPAAGRKALRAHYIEKTLQAVNRLLTEERAAQAIQDNRGLWQAIDPHVKVAGVAMLLVAAAVTKELTGLLALISCLLLTALASGITLRAYTALAVFPVVLLTIPAMLPGIFSWFTPGDAVYTLYTDVSVAIGAWRLPTTLAITKQGLHSTAFVLLRSLASLGLITVVMKTTPWHVFTRVLAKYGLSSLLVAVFDLTYRYLYIFLRLLVEFLEGRKSRVIGQESERMKMAWIGTTLANFLTLTKNYAQEVFYGMQARGYTGVYYTETRVVFGRSEGIFCILVFVFVYGLVFGG